MIEIEWAGRVEYGVAWEWQKALVAARNKTPDLADKLLLLEHPPTYTLGSRGRLEHLLFDEAALAQQGISLYWVDRGGDVTYHGPGQLVGYPILNLKRLHAERGMTRPDLHLYVREIEAMIIEALASFHVAGRRYKGYTGVWVDTADGPRKIAAIGIRVNGRGISSHGFALNIAPDLTHFAGIIPCGIPEHGVTSLSELLSQPLSVTDLLEPITAAFGRVLQIPVLGVSPFR